MSFRSLKYSYSNNCEKLNTVNSNYNIVPVDEPMGFASLTHATPYNQTKYFGIESAYPSACTKFRLRGCNDEIQPNMTKGIMFVDAIIRPAS